MFWSMVCCSSHCVCFFVFCSGVLVHLVVSFQDLSILSQELGRSTSDFISLTTTKSYL